MKIIILFFFLLFGVLSLYSNETYTYSYTLGSTGYNFNYENAKIIIQTPASDVLSEVQQLPFEWNFWGKTVNSYKVSENGFITFNTEEELGLSQNTTIPNQANPNNAIYVCWDGWDCSSTFWLGDNVQSITIGEAPNRIHIIQWVHMTQTGQSDVKNWGFFGVRIYEGGAFDIILSEKIV